MSPERNKTVIVITGPTAVGKTTAAIEIATHFKTEIISADSRQCFKELTIGVARPSQKELQQVRHYFIASHSIADEVNAVVFEQYSIAKINELFQIHDIVVMVGGTGLYIKAFCEGLDEIPPAKTEIRKKINNEFEKKGLSWLQDEISSKDPEFYKTGEIQNPQRVIRALEVMESTGESILHFRKGEKIKRNFKVIKIGLELSRDQLHENIQSRVDKMIATGLVEEVKKLEPFKQLNALQTVGYSEIFEHLAGKISLEQAIDDIKISTRQYAKRQMTWFRKDKEINWFPAVQLRAIIDLIERKK